MLRATVGVSPLKSPHRHTETVNIVPSGVHPLIPSHKIKKRARPIRLTVRVVVVRTSPFALAYRRLKTMFI